MPKAATKVATRSVPSAGACKRFGLTRYGRTGAQPPPNAEAGCVDELAPPRAARARACSASEPGDRALGRASDLRRVGEAQRAAGVLEDDAVEDVLLWLSSTPARAHLDPVGAVDRRPGCTAE